MKRIILFLIWFYRKVLKPYLNLYLPSNCRFRPTCSEYSEEVINKYGVLRGVLLSVKRILGCNSYLNYKI